MAVVTLTGTILDLAYNLGCLKANQSYNHLLE